jgi:two-component system sensor histidine kinase/response regulator
VRTRLLIVDDDPRNLDALVVVLKPLGCDFVRASSGDEALARLTESGPYDLVLLDLTMPGRDGIAVLKELRATPATADLPVVVVTAHNDRDSRLRVLEAGADDFLEKPLDGPVLWARVKNLLEMKHSRDAIAASRDELRAANDALKERHELVLRLQREQEEMAQFIVHDLKNPLGAITMCLDLLKEVKLGDPMLDEAVNDGATSAQRLNAMVGDLLTVAKMRTTGPTLDLQPVQVEDLLASVLRNFERAARAKRVKVQLDTAASGSLRADPRILTRVLENVLENALRHTPRDGVVELAAHRGTDLVLRVSNTGPTVPESERHRIFEKFAQSAAGSRGRLGLGLYFCKHAVEAHGGRIEVVESRSYPTAFEIHLPLERPSERHS